MKNLRKVVFFGTHDLAVPALETLAELDLLPKLIVTRPEAGLAAEPDDPSVHPVRDWAREHGVPVARSRRAQEPELRERVAAVEPDLLVVTDYGHPLPGDLNGTAVRGAIEVHPSLLPDLRGPHALRAALALGQSKTGVSVLAVEDEPWGGPILFREELEIGDRETFGELLPRARELACELLAQALKKLDGNKNNLRGKPQKVTKTSLKAPQIGGRHRKAPWSMDARAVYDRLRAYSPPSLRAFFRYRQIEILSGMPMEWVQAPYGVTGTYLGSRQGKLAVLCGEGTVFGIGRLRWPGGEVCSASDFAFAENLDVGDRFA